MACTDYTAYGDFLINGQFLDAIICPYQEQMGFMVFALMVYVAIGGALYIYTESIVIPLAISIFGGAVVITNLPSVAVQTAVIVTVLVIAIGVYLLVRRAEGAI